MYIFVPLNIFNVVLVHVNLYCIQFIVCISIAFVKYGYTVKSKFSSVADERNDR